MNKRKILLGTIIVLVFGVVAFFLWPRSFASKCQHIQSIKVEVVEESFDHDTDSFIYNADDPAFSQIMDVLGEYTYHISLGTLSGYVENKTALDGNEAGYWLNIYLYTEPDCYGDCISLISGGTGEIIFDDSVYRIGYFGNSTVLKMMDEVCQIVKQ